MTIDRAARELPAPDQLIPMLEAARSALRKTSLHALRDKRVQILVNDIHDLVLDALDVMDGLDA